VGAITSDDMSRDTIFDFQQLSDFGVGWGWLFENVRFLDHCLLLTELAEVPSYVNVISNKGIIKQHSSLLHPS
jgi:hypothetical protein